MIQSVREADTLSLIHIFHDVGEDLVSKCLYVHAQASSLFLLLNAGYLGDAPHSLHDARCIGEPEEMEEERRLCYVALTRAKERLCLTCARQRMIFGHTSMNLSLIHI